MKREKNFWSIICSLFLYCVIGSIMLGYFQQAKNTSYFKEYTTLTIAYFIVALIFFSIIIFYNIGIFEPFILISVLYLCIFIFTPMIFIIVGKTDAHGVNVMGGCIKATWIYVVSYISFVVGYITLKVNKKFCEIKSISNIKIRKNLNISYLIWGLAYLCTVIYILSTGKSIIQIITFGSSGREGATHVGSILGFISNFSYCMIIPWLYICFYDKRKILKIVITYLTLSSYVVRGFRFIIIIMLASYIIVFFRKRLKKPSLVVCLAGIISAFIFIGALGFARNNIKTGKNIEWSTFSVEDITYALESNFDIYKTFYGIVEHYPSEYEYTMGKSMFVETAFMFIPRLFWSNKPLAVDASVVLAIRRSVSEFAIRTAAMATPNIGEFYVEFGVTGCIIIMFILGIIAKWTTRYYYSKGDSMNKIIMYAVIMPTFLQLVIRGYTPSNFYLVLFLMLPLIIIKVGCKVKFINGV